MQARCVLRDAKQALIIHLLGLCQVLLYNIKLLLDFFYRLYRLVF